MSERIYFICNASSPYTSALDSRYKSEVWSKKFQCETQECCADVKSDHSSYHGAVMTAMLMHPQLKTQIGSFMPHATVTVADSVLARKANPSAKSDRCISHSTYE